MPKKKAKAAARPFYKSRPPKPGRAALPRGPKVRDEQQLVPTNEKDFPHAHPLASSHFTLREDGEIQFTAETRRRGEELTARRFRGTPQIQKNPRNLCNLRVSLTPPCQ